MSQTKRNRVVALLTSAAGLITAWSIRKHPEKLHAPEWVAYSVCMAFVLAGLVLLVRETFGATAYRWAVVSLLAFMAVPPVWISLGPGSRNCSAVFLGVEFLSPDTACRFTFGLGALMLVGMLVWAMREALVMNNAE